MTRKCARVDNSVVSEGGCHQWDPRESPIGREPGAERRRTTSASKPSMVHCIGSLVAAFKDAMVGLQGGRAAEYHMLQRGRKHVSVVLGLVSPASDQQASHHVF